MKHTMAERMILQIIDNEFMVKLHFAFQSEHKLYLVIFLMIIKYKKQVLDYVCGGELFYYLRKYVRFNE